MNRARRNLILGGSCFGGLVVAGLFPATCNRNQAGKDPAVPGGDSTRRPPGEPKPLIEEDIAPVLARLDKWFAEHLPADKYKFNPPASDAALDAFEKLVGLELPKAYRQIYRWHDGENDDRWGHFYGLPLLPLKEAARQWDAWKRVLVYFKGDPYVIPGKGWPAGAVDPAYINLRWIPLTHDGSGNHIGLDFDPWPGGRVGQIILYGRDEDVKAVLAESLGQFLDWFADLLESGNFRLDIAPGEQVLRQFRLKNPHCDGFMDGARKLLGAPGPF